MQMLGIMQIVVLCAQVFLVSKEGEQFQVVVRRFQERSEDKMSVVDDVIAADRTEQVSGGEGIDTGLLNQLGDVGEGWN